MAFGIGTNTQSADAGPVKGLQVDVACGCWFTSSGKLIPLRIKVQDEDGENETAPCRGQSAEGEGYSPI